MSGERKQPADPGAKQRAAEEESLKQPTKEDVHEQRQIDQPREGTIERGAPRRPVPPDVA